MPSPSSLHARPLTVLQVIPSLDTGGAERTTIDIAGALAARGDTALVASEGGGMESELAAAGGSLIRLPAATKAPGEMLRNAGRLARIIREQNVDIVHARSRAPAWSALLACRRTGTPFVTTYHGIYAEQGRLKRLYNSVMARGDVVIANSHYTASLITERYGTPQRRLAVIHRGTDLKRFDPAAVGEDRRAALRQAWGVRGSDRLIVNVARLTEWKGQMSLVEALARPPLSETGALLILAGDEQGRRGYLEDILDRTRVRQVAERVRVVGHCDDVPAAFAVADVAVVASIEPEAFGRAAVEAQAMGAPTVVTNLGATAETVLAPPAVAAEARSGWHVPANDPAALSTALAHVLGLSPAARALLAANARRHAAGFSLPVMTGQTLAVYDWLVSQRRNKPEKRRA